MCRDQHAITCAGGPDKEAGGLCPYTTRRARSLAEEGRHLGRNTGAAETNDNSNFKTCFTGINWKIVSTYYYEPKRMLTNSPA